MTENLSKSLNLIIVVHIQVFCLWTGNTWMTKKICTLINYILIPYKKDFSLCPHMGTRELSRAAYFFFFFKDFIFRKRGREGEREGEKHQYVVASCAPNWGPGPQPRHVP